jgi:hypothetical protein
MMREMVPRHVPCAILSAGIEADPLPVINATVGRSVKKWKQLMTKKPQRACPRKVEGDEARTMFPVLATAKIRENVLS